MQIMRIEDGAHVAQAVSGDGRNLRLCTFGKSKARNCRATQIVERHVLNASLHTCLAPRRTKTRSRPRLAVRSCKKSCCAWRPHSALP